MPALPAPSGDGAVAPPSDPAFLRAFFRLPSSTSDAEVLAYADALAQADAARSAADDAEGRLAFFQDAVGAPAAQPPPPPCSPRVLTLGMSPTLFPVDALPAPAAALVRSGAAAVGCDAAFVGVPVLVAMAGALGDALWAEVKRSWREPPTLWAAVVAESGGGKSPGMDHALGPVYAVERELGEWHAEAEREHRDAVAAFQSRPRSERAGQREPEPPPRQRFRIGDGTIEAVLDRLAHNPRGLVLVRDELAGLIAAHDRYHGSGGDEQAWIELWGGRQVVVDRKGDGTRVVARPAVSLVGGVQPEVLRALLGTGGRSTLGASGYLARLLLTLPPERPLPLTEADVPEATARAYDALVRALRAAPYADAEEGTRAEPRTVPFAPDARAALKAFVDENARLYGDLRGALRAAFVKLGSYAVRLALTLHAADAAAAGRLHAIPPISADAVRRAVALAAYFRREAIRAYGALGLLRDADEAAAERDARLAAALPERFGASDVEAAWAVTSSGAYKVLRRLMGKGLATDDGRGWYRRSAPEGTGEDDGHAFARVVEQVDRAASHAAGLLVPPTSHGLPLGVGTRIVVVRGALAGRRGVVTAPPVEEGGVRVLSAEVEGVPCRLPESDVEAVAG